jgi:large repetitive protein
MLFPTALFKAYKQRLRDTAPIAYWPLDELSGSTAVDISGNARNGAHTGVTLLQTGMGDGGASPLYDGVNDYTNIYSASLAGAFNGAEGSAAIWLRVANSGIWTDVTARRAFVIQIDSGNRFRIGRSSTNSRIDCDYSAGSTTKTVGISSLSSVDWLHFAITWSKSADQMKVYLSGAQSGTTQTALGTWSGGALSSSACVIGAATTAPVNAWSGYEAHAALWTRALPAAEVAELARVN